MNDPRPTLIELSADIVWRLSKPPYNETAGYRCTPWGEAEKLLDAYQAAVIDEVMKALQERAQEYSGLAEEEMRPSLEERAQEWYAAAEVAAKLKRATPEARDD